MEQNKIIELTVKPDVVVRKWPRVEAYQNTTLRCTPHGDFPEVCASKLGRAKILRTFVTLDEVWDYKKDEYDWDYAIGVNKYSENKAAAIAWALWFANESTYAVDNVAIPAAKGSAFPAVLDSFAELGVVYDTQNPAQVGEEGLFDKLDSESEIGLWQDPQKVRIIDAAMGTSKETFDDIMKDWNKRWAKARKDLGVTP